LSTLGFYVRVGRNDHNELMQLMAAGERGIFGFVIEAHNVHRHRELITEARKNDFDVILDPKTQPMAFPDSNTESLAGLPWGLERHHNVTDFDGAEGQRRAEQIVEFAITNGLTQVLGPTHVLSGANDTWLRRDIAMMNWMGDQIANSGSGIGLVYSLALPMSVLRRAAERQDIIAAIADARCDAIWLKIENFGDHASGEKTAAYIDACRDFHNCGVPIVGDHVGGLPGLGLLAFGAVGAIAHGVTLQQTFSTSNWRRRRTAQNGGQGWRVYFPQLDMLLEPKVANTFLETSPRIKVLCGCRDTHCCPKGVRDMIAQPARHAMYQRAREIEGLSIIPQNLRAGHYLDKIVRPVSDAVARVAALTGLGDELQRKMRTKQRDLSHLRKTIAHLVDGANAASAALVPSRREVEQIDI
jgi:hypothetical protein